MSALRPELGRARLGLHALTSAATGWVGGQVGENHPGLEDAATEFRVPGLELDWTCVPWDADLRSTGSGWSCYDFRGDRWLNIANADNQGYLRNAYRVLLTRARQGMLIFVPPGEPLDRTRSPAFYESTFDMGCPVG